MLYKYFTEKLLGLQDVDIEKLEEIDNSIHINCRLKRKPHKCPCCGKLTDKVHDYREQPIKDIPAFGKHIFIHLNKPNIVAPVASVSVTVFYICFLTKCKNKRQLDLYYRLFIYFFFFGFTPTIDIEPYNSNLDKLLDNKKQSSYKNYSVMAPPTGLEPVTS